MRYQLLALSGLLSAAAATAQHNTLTPAEVAAGYELLFNGQAVSSAGSGINWVTYQNGSEVNTGIEAGWKVFPADSAFGKDAQPRDIRSKKKYKDFSLSFDFWSNGNSGIYYRTLVAGGYGWETGVEFAIDNTTTILPWIRSGAAYELIVADPSTYKKDAWNTAKIIAISDSVEHWMNGAKVVAYKYWDAQWQRALSGQIPGLNGARSKWNNWDHFSRPTRGATSGYIQEGYLGIQGDHPGTSKFRNVKVATVTQWPTAIGGTDPKDRLAETTNLLKTRIGWIDHGNGATLKLDFTNPYQATVRDLSGKLSLPEIRASEPKSFTLNRADFRPGIYFVQVRIAGLALNKSYILR